MTLHTSRRRFLGGLAAVAAGGVFAPSLLTACGNDAVGGRRLRVATWPIYIDVEPEGEATLDLFEKATGIPVDWNEDINDNLEYFAKIQPTLSAGKTIRADIITPTYWLVPRLADLGWLEPLPIDAIPNARNLLPGLQRPTWDPEGRWSLPWQTGTTGIAYNRKATGGKEIRSMDDLFHPDLAGKVGFLTEMRDTLGLLMLADGKNPETASVADAERAIERLRKAKSDGQIRKFTGNDYQDELTKGSFAACVAWSGDVAQLALENPDLAYVVPDEGGMKWADAMVIPKGTTDLDAVAKFMDFVYDPTNAARITASVQYISPVQGVREALRAAGGDAAALADSTALFPDAATEKRLHTFRSLTVDEESRLAEAFSELTGA